MPTRRAPSKDSHRTPGGRSGNDNVSVAHLHRLAGRSPRLRLGDVLLRSGAISGEQLARALEEQQRTRRPLGEVLVELGFITDDTMRQALGRQSNVSFIDLDRVTAAPAGNGNCPTRERHPSRDAVRSHRFRIDDVLVSLDLEELLRVLPAQTIADFRERQVRPAASAVSAMK